MLPFFRKSRTRTTLLGVAALGTLLWGAVAQLNVDPSSLVAQLLILFAALILVIGLAAVCVLLFVTLRRQRRKRQSPE